MVKKPQGKIAGISLEGLMSRIKETDLNTFFIFGAIILILIVGAFALFHADAQNAARGNPACGKIVIAADGFSLASNVSLTLPEARYFLVVNPLTGRMIESFKNPYRGQTASPELAYLVAGKGEEALIVQSIDQQSYDILGQFGIRVFGGYQGRAQKVVRLYRKARISALPTANDPQTLSMGQPGQVYPQPGFGRGMGQGMGAGPAYMQAQNHAMWWPNAQGFQQAQVMPVQGMFQPNCPLPGNVQGTGMSVMQAQQGMMYRPNCPLPNTMQGAGIGMQQPAMQQVQGMFQPGCPLPIQGQGQIFNNAPAAQQAGWFGLGQTAFICPNCNWRMKANRQGNKFPACPNCGAASMALDMGAQNANQNEAGVMPEGMWAAQTQQINPQFNQMAPQYYPMNNQQNFVQQQGAPDVNGSFTCPNCNWRMYSQQGANEFPQCPNCGQIMARGGNGNGAQVALTQNAPAATTSAPPIPADAQMQHTYRGVCTNCHQILGAVTQGNLNVLPGNQAQNAPVVDTGSARITMGGTK
ncbi:MAG: magnetochrome domain-containing protein [Candidatus Omnitrophica bacterium]|nr:magnetochrome domain-containing protein [Candidatus Omnitrophota bacterium]